MTTVEADRSHALRTSTAALRRSANYSLPAELDRRMLDLGERKDSLSGSEAAELQAWVKFTQQRSLEKFEAQVALQRLESQFPETAAHPS
jgi:hypothetical protein